MKFPDVLNDAVLPNNMPLSKTLSEKEIPLDVELNDTIENSKQKFKIKKAFLLINNV